MPLGRVRRGLAAPLFLFEGVDTMKAKIKALNAAYAAGDISVELYRVKARCVLSTLDWQRRIKYENLLYITA